MTPKALVVEDDERVIDSIEDELFSIGHDHEWVTNQHDAQQLLKTTEFSYVLLDLQIPAKPHRGGAAKEYGVNLLSNIQKIKGRGRLPVIVMTAHFADCLDLTKELLANGAKDFIAKPFTNKGRPLAKVIKEVLGEHQAQAVEPRSSRAQQVTSERFAGGELAIFADRAELCGVKIMTDMGTGQSLMLLRELSRQDHQDRFVRLSAEELAEAIGAKGGVGTITGCVRGIRRNVVSRLGNHRGLHCELDDLIRNDTQGYYLRDWITLCPPGRPGAIPIVTGDKLRAPGGIAASALRGVTSVTGDTTGGKGVVPLNERQQWALVELRNGSKLQRAMLEARFGVHARTAKRDLADLSHRGLITFVGDGREGYYVLQKSPES